MSEKGSVCVCVCDYVCVMGKETLKGCVRVCVCACVCDIGSKRVREKDFVSV